MENVGLEMRKWQAIIERFFIRKWQQNFCDIILQHNSGKCVEKSKTAENRDEKEAEKSNQCITGVYSMISDQWFDEKTFFTLHETVPNNARML